MPGGMLAMVVIDAVLTLISPRPPGSMHGGQIFDLERMPRAGETLRTEVWCVDKEIRKQHKWVRMRTQSRALGSGELLFTGIMSLLVPQYGVNSVSVLKVPVRRPGKRCHGSVPSADGPTCRR